MVCTRNDGLTGKTQKFEINLQEAPKKQKTWYDQQAQHHEYQPGWPIWYHPYWVPQQLVRKTATGG